MKNIQLERTLRLLRRTGDSAVVVDPGSDEVFLLMNLDAYERLLDEIDAPGPAQDFGSEDALPAEDDLALADTLTADFDDAPTAEEELSGAGSATPEERPERSNTKAEPLDFSGVWPKKELPKLENEESLEDVPDEGEEEKFYLEPVE